MIDQQKKEIRKQIKILKNQVSFDEKKIRSKNIFLKLEKFDEFKNAKVIMLYWSMKDEVYTHNFIQKWAHAKQIILPSVKGDELELKEFVGINDLVSGVSFGIGEPSGKIFDQANKIDLIVVPGIAFDNQKNRLGRGKAYYDKLLKTNKAFKVGVCFDFQLLTSVPVDNHDIKMDLIISE